MMELVIELSFLLIEKNKDYVELNFIIKYSYITYLIKYKILKFDLAILNICNQASVRYQIK